MPRSIKRAKPSTRTQTKVQTVTSIKLALSVLALGFSALAAAAATTPVVKKPDLVISQMQVNNTGYYYNNLPVVHASAVVKNIGNLAAPGNRPFRLLLKPSSSVRLMCGFGAYTCQPGKSLPETKKGSGVYYVEVMPGANINPGSQRLAEFLIGGLTEKTATVLPVAIGIEASVAASYPELKITNNGYLLKFMTKNLIVKPFNATDFYPSVCGYGYGYNNAVGCYELPVSSGSYSECGYGYGYNAFAGCVKN